MGFQVTVEDKHGAKTKSRVSVFVSDVAKPIEVQVKLVGPSTPPYRGDIVELKTQIIGMQPVSGSYSFSEKSGPQAITVVTDSEAKFNISQGDYETSVPDIHVQMPSDCKPLDGAIPESERYVFEVRLNDTNNREYAAESTVDLICPQFIIQPSNNTIGLGETLTMKGKLTGFHKNQNYNVSIFSRQMGQNLGAGNSCLDSSCNPPFKEFVFAGDPCVGNTEKIVFTGFVVPENQPKVWVQHDVAVTVSCTGIQPQNHPPVVNQLPTFETEVNKEIVITLSAYDPDQEENENLTAIEHSKPQHGDLNQWKPVDGEVTYHPHQNYEGPDSFTVKVKDMHGLESENEGNVSIMVKPSSIQNHPPVVNQLPTFETEVNKEIVITLSAYDPDQEENENLTAIEHSKPQHGDLNQWKPVDGEVTYHPHQNYEGPDSFTFKVKDMHGLESEKESTILIMVKSPVNSSIAGGMFALPELKLTGPSSAMPGERVTLVGELQGIGENQISNPIFNQLGSTVDPTECDPGSNCTYPSITFDMPDCGGDQEDVKFELVLSINGKQYATPPHAVALKCIDIANEDVESNLGNVKNDTDDSNLGSTSIDDTVKDDTGDSSPEGSSLMKVQ